MTETADRMPCLQQPFFSFQVPGTQKKTGKKILFGKLTNLISGSKDKNQPSLASSSSSGMLSTQVDTHQTKDNFADELHTVKPS